ncbi:hypothetical protein NPIL_645041, partial [Nephila pilipes]
TVDKFSNGYKSKANNNEAAGYKGEDGGGGGEQGVRTPKKRHYYSLSVVIDGSEKPICWLCSIVSSPETRQTKAPAKEKIMKDGETRKILFLFGQAKGRKPLYADFRFNPSLCLDPSSCQAIFTFFFQCSCPVSTNV